MGEPVLEIADVRKRYGGTVALDGVSLSVRAGEVFGLLGPNGAGKTTLLSIAAGLLAPDSGGVSLFGQSFGPKARELRHFVGLGTQDLSIYPELSATENLRFFGKLYGLRGSELAARVGEVLAAVALTDRANDRAVTFSGGMKRRLNLACAIVHRPKVLFLDEPTTGVDPQSRAHIFDQVRALSAAGVAIVYTSHYMEEVQALCSRIAIMDGGTVRACDTLPNLLKRLHATLTFVVEGAPPGFAERFGATNLSDVVATARPTPPAPLPERRGEKEEDVSLRSPSEEPSESNSSHVPTNSFSPLPSGRGAGGVGNATPEANDGARVSASPLPSGRGAGGVGNATPEASTSLQLTLTAPEVGPALAAVARECAACGATLVSATATEPTLERVFLTLTGRAMRD